MRGKKRRGRGKNVYRKRGGPPGFPSQGKRQTFEEGYEVENEETQNEPEMPIDLVEREGNIAVDLLNRKIQLRKLVDELNFKKIEDEEYTNVSEENRYSSPSSGHEGQRKLETSHKGKEGEGPSSKVKSTQEKKKSKAKKKNPEVIEDEEVLRIIGELEKEVDTSFSELIEDVSDAELDEMSGCSNVMNTTSSDFKMDSIEKQGRRKIEICFEDSKDAPKAHSVSDLMHNKEVGGLVNHGPYSRVLVVGDCRLKLLEKCWPEYAYIRPQFLIEPQLTLSDLKDFILSCTDLPHLENGTLLICSVGLHDIIDFTDYRDCHAIQDHEPMKIMTLKEKSVEDIVKLVLMRLKKAHKMLEEILDSSSVVCFTAIIPCDPIVFFDKESQSHTPKGHAIMNIGLQETLDILRHKIKVVCERVNKHLSKLSPMPSIWDIMCSYHLNRQITGRVFFDGMNISMKTVELLSCQLNRFFQELFYGVEIKSSKFIEFNREQEVIVVGDSRLQNLQKVWNGDKPEFYCEAELGFYNFSKYITTNLVGLKDKIVLVCLGLNDLLQFIEDDVCNGKDHEPNKIAVSICEKYETVEKYMEVVMKNLESSVITFCKNNSSMLFFATTYPINLDTYVTSQVKAHKEKTGHDITPPQKNSQISEKLEKLLYLLNSHIRLCSSKLSLPIWDMYHVVCRGYEASTLSKDVLKDGIYPGERTTEELIRSYYSFVNGRLRQNCFEDEKIYKLPYRPLPKYEEKEENHRKKSEKMEHTLVTNSCQSLKSSSDGKLEQEGKALHPIPDQHLKEDTQVGHPTPPESKSVGSQKPVHHVPKPLLESGLHRYPRETSPHPPDYYTNRSSNTEAKKHKASSPVHQKHLSRFSQSPEANRVSRFSRPAGVEYSGLEERSRDLNYGFRSPERFYDSRFSRSPERLQNARSRSPDRIRKSEYSRSPERFYKRKYSRSPDTDRKFKWYRATERSHRLRRPSHNSGEQSTHRNSEYGDRKCQRHTEREENPLDIFKHSIRVIQRQCHKEKDVIIREALLDLCDTHHRECERYLNQPDAHPDYSKEYWQFIDKKKTFIIDLGGDPESYDYLKDWGKFWPTRMFDLFKESWVLKKAQCISMISSKKRRSSSSSSSSSSSTLSNPSRKRKHSKKKASKRMKSFSPEPKKKHGVRENDKWKPLPSSSPDSRDDDFIREIKPKKKIDIVLQSQVSSVPCVATHSLHTSQKVIPQNVEKKSVKVVEVLGILAYMKDKLGVFGMPVSVLYEKAVDLEKKGSDPNILLEDEETWTLLSMLNDKIGTIIEEREGSAIQKAIMVEAQSLLKDLLDEVTERRKRRSTEMTVNVGQIARLTMGKTISETIMTIKNFLLYEGFSDVSRERLENIYMSVKDEQLKINNSTRQLQESLDMLSSVEKSHQRSDLLSNPRTSQLRNDFLPPGDELTEEFFIGQKSFSKHGPILKHSLTTATTSTSKLDHGLELDEEFFTGRKFKKPNFSDPVSNTRTNDDAEKGGYVPRRHVLPPPAPLISGVHFSQSSLHKTPPAVSEPKVQASNLDYEMMRKCLATLKNIRK